jgi:hypothetical protein
MRTLEQILSSRDVRNELNSAQNLMTGLVIPTPLQQFSTFGNVITQEGFIFGKSVWGIDKFGTSKSPLAEKYGL